jgi:CheY-like chemotaxis protein
MLDGISEGVGSFRGFHNASRRRNIPKFHRPVHARGISRMESLRVLVVEDDVLIGTLLAEMLAEMGHRVEAVVTTQDEAVQAAHLYAPDLIVIDEKLQTGSGSSAMAEILRKGFIPHVLMSGGSRRASQAGSAFLAKPFMENDLRQGMQTALMINGGL